MFAAASLGALPSYALAVFWSVNSEHLLAYPAYWLAVVFAGYVTTIVVTALSRDHHSALSEILRSLSGRRFLSFAGARLIMTLLLMLLALVVSVPGIILFGIAPEEWLNIILPVAILVSLAAITFGFLVYGLSSAATVVEKLGPGAAVRRSWQITTGRRKDFLFPCLLPALLSAMLFAIESSANGRHLPEVTDPRQYGSLFQMDRPVASADSLPEALSGALGIYAERMFSTALWATLLAMFFIVCGAGNQ